MTDPKVSIVVPIYNPGELLRRTLSSIAAQTEPSWEVLCMDDGSTDNSADIADEFAAKDPRFHVFRSKNVGPTFVRNNAMAHAKGTYIYFCDHDDCMHPRLLEYALWAVETYDTDFLLFGNTTVHDASMPVFEDLKPFGDIEVRQPDNIFYYLKPRQGWCLPITVWSYFTRLDYSLAAPLTPGSGIPRLLKLAAMARKPMISDAVLYYYSDFNPSMLRAPITADFIRMFADSLRDCAELYDYGRKDVKDGWRYVEPYCITKNIKYMYNWLKRSKAELTPEEYAERARVLAEEMAFFADRGCLRIGLCGVIRYIAYRMFVRRWGAR